MPRESQVQKFLKRIGHRTSRGHKRVPEYERCYICRFRSNLNIKYEGNKYYCPIHQRTEPDRKPTKGVSKKIKQIRRDHSKIWADKTINYEDIPNTLVGD